MSKQSVKFEDSASPKKSYKKSRFKKTWWDKLKEQWETSDMVDDTDVDAEIRVIFRELVIYVFFLTVVLVSAFGLTGETRFYYTKAMEDLFVNTAPPNMAKPFSQITTIADFWLFAETVMLDGFFWDYWYRAKDKHKKTAEDNKKILYENKLLGVPRLRQVRVRPNSCFIQEDFRRSFATCYAEYSSDAEDHTSFGPALGTAWNYNDPSEVGAISFWGKIATYRGGGYYQDLPVTTKDDMALAIATLKDNIWIRRGTRAIFLDFTVYNANVNLFCIVKLVVELPPTGGVLPSWKFNTVKLLRYVSPFDYFVLGCEFMFIAYILFYIFEEVCEIIHFRLEYLRKSWNLFDLTIIVISLICICISIYRTVVVDDKIDRLIEYTEEYPNFERVGFWEIQYQNLSAVVVFFVWVKIFKFIKFNKTMNQLSMTLRKCSKDIMGFSVMFFIVFLAYAQLGHLIFGDQLENFNNLVRSSFTLLRTILGDFDYDSIADVDRIAGPIFFLSYIFLVFFILLNVFLAIISDTYSEVKAETEAVDVYDMGRFLCRGIHNLLIKMRCLKEVAQDELPEKQVTGRTIRETLLKHNFTEDEVNAFLTKYGIHDEDRILDEEYAKKILKDMEGKTNDEILQEMSTRGDYVSIIEFNKLKMRVSALEVAVDELAPKVSDLTRIIEEIFED